MPIFDCHCHSEYSSDGTASISEILENAVRLGRAGQTVSDHYDPLSPASSEPLEPVDRIMNCISETFAFKQKYEGTLKVLCGVEIGSWYRGADNCAEIMNDKRLDVVIGSVHSLSVSCSNGDIKPYSPSVSEPFAPQQIMETYMADEYRTAAFADVDVLAHPTYLERYLVKDGVPMFDADAYCCCCEDILRVAIRRDIAIEINLKSLKVNKNVPFSEFDLFKTYRDLGGKLVTLGSDAHTLSAMADLPQCTELLKSAGFDEACYFEKRKPVFYPL